MSYILDALKRAEAERSRGAVPGLQAQPTMPTATAPSPMGRLRWAAVAGVSVALLFTAGVVWRLNRAPEAPAIATAASAVAAPTTLAPAASPVTLPTPVSVPVTTEHAAAPRPPLGAALPASAAVSAPVTMSSTSPAATIKPASSTPSGAAAATPNAAAVPAAASVEARVPSANELPEDVRRSLPALAITGVMYSENAAHRMLIVGGQVFHEGEEPAPGLKLELIRPKSAVFSYRGQRYSQSF